MFQINKNLRKTMIIWIYIVLDLYGQYRPVQINRKKPLFKILSDFFSHLHVSYCQINLDIKQR